MGQFSCKAPRLHVHAVDGAALSLCVCLSCFLCALSLIRVKYEELANAAGQNTFDTFSQNLSLSPSFLSPITGQTNGQRPSRFQ